MHSRFYCVPNFVQKSGGRLNVTRLRCSSLNSGMSSSGKSSCNEINGIAFFSRVRPRSRTSAAADAQRLRNQEQRLTHALRRRGARSVGVGQHQASTLLERATTTVATESGFLRYRAGILVRLAQGGVVDAERLCGPAAAPGAHSSPTRIPRGAGAAVAARGGASSSTARMRKQARACVRARVRAAADSLEAVVVGEGVGLPAHAQWRSRRRATARARKAPLSHRSRQRSHQTPFGHSAHAI